ncbi:hypothetical protein V8E36_006535 [Tilletia maclaganii]
MQQSSIPTPAYPDPALTPSIQAQRRLTATRRKQLVRAASRNWDDPPPPPGLNECCGSSCDPCVKTLHKEELGAWRERWGETALAAGKQAREAQVSIEEDGQDASAAAAGSDDGSRPNLIEAKQRNATEDHGTTPSMPGAWIDW